MGDIFKLRINTGNTSIELEGSGSLVHTIFSELREHGIGKLSMYGQDEPPCSFEHPSSSGSFDHNCKRTADEGPEQKETESLLLPNITDVVLKNLPKKEPEWMLIYALYASEQCTRTFTKADLRQMYQSTKRQTENRMKNFSANLKKMVTENWIISINDSEFALTEAGKAKALEILRR